ncbi:MAG: hypothetical protein HRU78_05775 [Gammaproteobacteria bacterium]|nr:MAG: hypothetical protein HRU78_05775 [Gammaproteobacteria bacterium]
MADHTFHGAYLSFLCLGDAAERALRLRAAAMHAKKEILRRLNTNSAQSPICEWRYWKNDNIAKLKSLSVEIENFKEGIFKP